MTTKTEQQATLLAKLHSETAKIRWHELQRFFAQGSVMLVNDGVDMIELAAMMAQDDADALQLLIDAGKVSPPTNDQARAWHALDRELWSVVVAPFVLVQENSSGQGKAQTGDVSAGV